jgi:hypothetical protein
MVIIYLLSFLRDSDADNNSWLKEPHQRFVQPADVICLFEVLVRNLEGTDFTIELSALTRRSAVLFKE